MILAALAFFLTVDGPRCADVRCTDDIPAPTQTAPHVTPTPKPPATPAPTPPSTTNCSSGFLRPSFDFVPIKPGTIYRFCFDHPAASNRLTVATNDRSGVNLCAKIRLTVVPPAGSGQNVQAQEQQPADITVRYFSPPMSPVGRYQVIVEGLPGSCAQGKFLVYWTDR